MPAERSIVKVIFSDTSKLRGKATGASLTPYIANVTNPETSAVAPLKSRILYVNVSVKPPISGVDVYSTVLPESVYGIIVLSI